MHHPQLGKTDSTPNPAPRPDDDVLNDLERSFAYEFAGGAVEHHCVPVTDPGDPLGETWFDLERRDRDLSQEVHYLTSRRLLEVHPEHPSWVRICDEGEPLPATEGQVQ